MRGERIRLVGRLALVLLIPVVGLVAATPVAQQWQQVSAARAASRALAQLDPGIDGPRLHDAQQAVERMRDSPVLTREVAVLGTLQQLAGAAADEVATLKMMTQQPTLALRLRLSAARGFYDRSAAALSLSGAPAESWQHLRDDRRAGLLQAQVARAVATGRVDLTSAEVDQVGRPWVSMHSDVFEAQLSTAASQVDAIAAAKQRGLLRAVLTTCLYLAAAALAYTFALRWVFQRLRHHGGGVDALTGLGDRAAAMLALDALATTPAHTPAAVMFIDLDDFKRANDVHGHRVGDQVLVETAARLRHCAPAAVTTRLGGDEFLVIAHADSARELESLATRVVAALREPMIVGGRVVRVGASVGMVAATGMDSGDELLRWADLALYRAKEMGRNQVVVCTEAMRREVANRIDMEQRLAAALDAEHLHFALQPVWDLLDQRITGFEALARWTTVEGRVVTPDEFIPVAENSGLIDQLDNMVLLRAAAEVVGWPEFRDGDVRLSVNISGRHLLSPTIVDDVRFALIASGLPGNRLIVEITESVLVTDLITACEHLAALRDLGAQIAIDDFGSGFTSLGHLRVLPADILKIDRGFIASLGTAADDNLMRVLIEAARSRGMAVVAEGVETAAQLDGLRSMMCDSIQGHLLGAATTPSAARALLRRSVEHV